MKTNLIFLIFLVLSQLSCSLLKGKLSTKVATKTVAAATATAPAADPLTTLCQTPAEKKNALNEYKDAYFENYNEQKRPIQQYLDAWQACQKRADSLKTKIVKPRASNPPATEVNAFNTATKAYQDELAKCKDAENWYNVVNKDMQGAKTKVAAAEQKLRKVCPEYNTYMQQQSQTFNKAIEAFAKLKADAMATITKAQLAAQKAVEEANQRVATMTANFIKATCRQTLEHCEEIPHCCNANETCHRIGRSKVMKVCQTDQMVEDQYNYHNDSDDGEAPLY